MSSDAVLSTNDQSGSDVQAGAQGPNLSPFHQKNAGYSNGPHRSSPNHSQFMSPPKQGNLSSFANPGASNGMSNNYNNPNMGNLPNQANQIYMGGNGNPHINNATMSQKIHITNVNQIQMNLGSQTPNYNNSAHQSSRVNHDFFDCLQLTNLNH
jgi:hypothetical protein